MHTFPFLCNNCVDALHLSIYGSSSESHTHSQVVSSSTHFSNPIGQESQAVNLIVSLLWDRNASDPMQGLSG